MDDSVDDSPAISIGGDCDKVVSFIDDKNGVLPPFISICVIEVSDGVFKLGHICDSPGVPAIFINVMIKPPSGL